MKNGALLLSPLITLCFFIYASIAYAAITINEIEDLAQLKYSEEDFTFEKGEGYEIHEYVTPNGGKGIQVYEFDDKGNVTSYGYGPEAEERSGNFIIPTTFTANSVSVSD